MDLKLPPLGEGVDSGTVVGILVKEGDQINKGQGVIELETGKAVAPVPASASGKVSKILVSVGDKISVGAAIVSIGEGGAAPAAAAKPAPAKAAPAKPAAPRPGAQSSSSAAPAPVEEDMGEPVEEPAEDGPEPATSPSIRRIARELGLNLRSIRGSENGGRIVIEDVKNYIARLKQQAARPAVAAPGAPSIRSAAPAPQIDFSKWGQIAKKPMTPLRKVISQRMGESWAAVPRVTQFDEADITLVTELRKKYADAYDKKGSRLTVTSFSLRVVADALKKFPVFNSSLDTVNHEVIYKEYFNIGMAVDTEQGLIVPVLRDVDKKDLATLSKELNDLAVKTRDRKISMDELQGGTFTISNQGGIGGAHFTPIINLPEVAILGIGRGLMKPVVRDGKIEPRLMLPLALSYDHRVIDGGTAARFMLEIVAGFEKFNEAAVKLA